SKDTKLTEVIVEMAKCVANQSGGGLLELRSIDLDLLDEPIQPDRTYLEQLETLNKCLVLYNWMSFRFPGVFPHRPLAMQAKRLSEEAIVKCLAAVSETIAHVAYSAAMENLDVDSTSDITDSTGVLAKSSTTPDLTATEVHLVGAGCEGGSKGSPSGAVSV